MSNPAYWTRVAHDKTFTHPFRADLFGRHVRRSERVLDLGCGYGRLTHELVEAGWQNTVGADSSLGMIERGREEHPALDFVHLTPAPGARSTLPFADGSFDAVLLFSVLTCIPGGDEEASLLTEVARVLRPGGVLHISDLLLQTDERNVARYDAGEASGAPRGVFMLDEGVQLRHFDRDVIAGLLAADFDSVHFEELDVITMNGNSARGFQSLARRRSTGAIATDLQRAVRSSPRSTV